MSFAPSLRLALLDIPSCFVISSFGQEINLKTAKSEFCGPDKIISPETMKQLDEEIESAKSCCDRLRKKSAKKQ